MPGKLLVAVGSGVAVKRMGVAVGGCGVWVAVGSEVALAVAVAVGVADGVWVLVAVAEAVGVMVWVAAAVAVGGSAVAVGSVVAVATAAILLVVSTEVADGVQADSKTPSRLTKTNKRKVVLHMAGSGLATIPL